MAFTPPASVAIVPSVSPRIFALSRGFYRRVRRPCFRAASLGVEARGNLRLRSEADRRAEERPLIRM